MKYLLIATLILMSGCSNTQIWQTAHAIDVAQTIQISKHPECYSESNRFTKAMIGSKPSEEEVYMWGAGTAIAHYFLSKAAKGTRFEKFLYVGTGMQLNSVVNNHAIGLRVNGISSNMRDFCDRRAFKAKIRF